MEKTKIMVLNENLRASSDACAAQATVTVATAKSVARNKKVVKPYIDLKDRNGHSCHLIWKNLTSGLFYIRWFSTKRDKWVLSEEMLLHQACKRAEAMVYPGSWLDEI